MSTPPSPAASAAQERPSEPVAVNGEAGLRERIVELEAAVRARDDFLALAAHELRSPLNTLALRLAVLERMAANNADQPLRDEIQRARRSADRYVRRAVVLLDVSRLNTGQLEPARSPVDIRQLVEDAVDAYRDDAQFQGVTLRAEVDDDGVGWWDAHMAEEILCNLISNALKYGQHTPVRVRAAVQDNTARFEVADQGPGIDAAHVDRIFEKFERIVHGTHYRGGFGLGLWIVGRMVAAHGGSIQVESQAGRGSVFRVTLPMGHDNGRS
ncbi:sensor histidine kinase [Ramlibacter tataouinensis]|uniref:histidine kinase n=1 Tax=Ramlibacter tataouinensis (strain ATCC BAA-407 / DSM 14655 / LMG 21543 / TTB310) TaxID=365046 RepID=F5Y0R4_RAMTT|nr:HAMP domain-containing sensor histidine kinase [Ramlibacter tataouinensis]AEG94658.1 candidate histidine kinase, classic [Ramlibacter tataouinensis TTB310]